MLIITISYLTPEDSHVNLTIQYRIADVAHYNDKDTKYQRPPHRI